MPPPAASVSQDPTIKVLVVDDSLVIRGFMVRALEKEADIVVAGKASNGRLAIDALTADPDIDVIVLDIEMPVMDGLTAIPELLKVNRQTKILMASTLTQRNAEFSLKALNLGATDYLPKPTSAGEGLSRDEFELDLVRKVRAIGRINARRRALGTAGGATASTAAAPAATRVKTRPLPARVRRPEVLAIGSSTGGPQALMKLLKAVPSSIGIPVVITQHMPATFTKTLAGHLDTQTSWTCAEGQQGDILKPGHAYVAPGDFHMLMKRAGTQLTLEVNQDPKENFCRPAVDPMYRSVADALGDRALGIILTGMGHDGLEGTKYLLDKGGALISQDEESSVVWGMPGAVAKAGLSSMVAPIEQLAKEVVRLTAR